VSEQSPFKSSEVHTTPGGHSYRVHKVEPTLRKLVGREGLSREEATAAAKTELEIVREKLPPIVWSDVATVVETGRRLAKPLSAEADRSLYEFFIKLHQLQANAEFCLNSHVQAAATSAVDLLEAVRRDEPKCWDALQVHMDALDLLARLRTQTEETAALLKRLDQLTAGLSASSPAAEPFWQSLRSTFDEDGDHA